MSTLAPPMLLSHQALARLRDELDAATAVTLDSSLHPILSTPYQTQADLAPGTLYRPRPNSYPGEFRISPSFFEHLPLTHLGRSVLDTTPFALSPGDVLYFVATIQWHYSSSTGVRQVGSGPATEDYTLYYKNGGYSPLEFRTQVVPTGTPLPDDFFAPQAPALTEDPDHPTIDHWIYLLAQVLPDSTPEQFVTGHFAVRWDNRVESIG